MTAKEFVKERYPKARVERHVEGMIKGMQKPYWLIRDGNAYYYMASGTSESNAWVNAKKFIQNQDKETQEAVKKEREAYNQKKRK